MTVVVQIEEDNLTGQRLFGRLFLTVGVGVVPDHALDCPAGGLGGPVHLKRGFGIAEQRRLEMDPPVRAGRTDAEQVVVLRVLVGLSEVRQALVEYGVPEFFGIVVARAGVVARHVPSVTRVHHHPQRAMVVDHVLLGDGEVVRVERARHAPLGVHEVGILVRKRVDR